MPDPEIVVKTCPCGADCRAPLTLSMPARKRKRQTERKGWRKLTQPGLGTSRGPKSADHGANA